MTGSFGNTTHWDTKGHRVGTSQSGAFSTHHYDSRGHRVGKTEPGFFGSKKTRWDD
jgi:hypothetical protein